jgi:hypothetical protein
LHFILSHCDVLFVRLVPSSSRALSSNPLQTRLSLIEIAVGRCQTMVLKPPTEKQKMRLSFDVGSSMVNVHRLTRSNLSKNLTLLPDTKYIYFIFSPQKP